MSAEAGAMRHVIQKLVHLARNTFLPLSQRVPPTPEQLQQLVQTANQVKAADLNFDPALVNNADLYQSSDPGAPVTYIDIYEDDDLTMGVFVLRNGFALPLHDHPEMYGVCKVIYGKLSVRSFSHCDDSVAVPESLQKVGRMVKATIAEKAMEFDTNSCCCLDPKDGNFHEIRAVGGPAAFLDILAPPYDTTMCGEDEPRTCRYYREVLRENGISWLQVVPQPRNFWCERAPYRGPDLLIPHGDI